jgi:hypothetical protein
MLAVEVAVLMMYLPQLLGLLVVMEAAVKEVAQLAHQLLLP